MLILMESDCRAPDVDAVVQAVEERGYRAHVIPGTRRVAVVVTGNRQALDPGPFRALPGVASTVSVTSPYRLAGREVHPDDTEIQVGPLTMGGGCFTVIAGPCSVESEEQIVPLARTLRDLGANMLRGGAFKPRSSPYAFQGLGEEGLRLLARAGAESGLPVVTEALDLESLEYVEHYADMIQIGARNMRNVPLLQRAGRSRRPVFLKRGMAASLEEFLMAAEYVLCEGNPNVALCERGIRTWNRDSRFTLDLAAVPMLHHLTHLPIFVDPSHATGRRRLVPPMARAALAAGADGVMLEVHAEPPRSLSDAAQALPPSEFGDLVEQMRALAPLVHRDMEVPA